MFKRKPKKLNNAFAFFRQAVHETFESLCTEFGFRHVETIEHVPECVVKYRNQTTGIDVSYEWQSSLSIDLVKLERSGNKVTEAAKAGFSFLLQIRQPAIDTSKFHGSDKEWTTAYIEQLLREYATLLRENARDVLTGDFSIFPELKKLAAANRRNRNKEMFGTYNGASPRFSSHPTLEQVFAGAKDVDPELVTLFGDTINQDKTDSYIYEAYWDHRYSIREIGDFLNETEETIKRKLDEWDDHA